MRHEMLTQRALFCHRANTKRGTLSQHFMMHVVLWSLVIPVAVRDNALRPPKQTMAINRGILNLCWLLTEKGVEGRSTRPSR